MSIKLLLSNLCLSNLSWSNEAAGNNESNYKHLSHLCVQQGRNSWSSHNMPEAKTGLPLNDLRSDVNTMHYLKIKHSF